MVVVYENTFIEISHTIGTVVYYKVNEVLIEVLQENEALGYDKIWMNGCYDLIAQIDVANVIRIFEMPITFNEKIRLILRHTWLTGIPYANYGDLALVI